MNAVLIKDLIKEMQRGLTVEKLDNRIERVRYGGLTVKLLQGVSMDDL